MMTYPLNMRHRAAGGFALANDEAEHRALSDAGYEPKHVAGPAVETKTYTDGTQVTGVAPLPDESPTEPTVETLRAQLDAKGIAYDNRWGVKRLSEALEA